MPVIDHVIHFLLLREPVRNKLANTIAHAFVEQVFSVFSLPETLHHDRCRVTSGTFINKALRVMVPSRAPPFVNPEPRSSIPPAPPLVALIKCSILPSPRKGTTSLCLWSEPYPALIIRVCVSSH